MVFFVDYEGCIHIKLNADPLFVNSAADSPYGPRPRDRPEPPQSSNSPFGDPPPRPLNSTPLFSWNEHLPPPPAPHTNFDDTQPNLPQILDPNHHEYGVCEQLPYKSLRSLGRGGYALVDEVTDTRRMFYGTFARKVLRIPYNNPGAFVKSVWNEIAIIKRLKSVRHFVQVVETYTQGRHFGIVMIPVADMNLEQYLEQNPQPDVEDPIYGWFGCLAAGLEYLHQRKIKHRDIKPANILISNGSVLYADFGIAKDVQDEATTSTTGYVDAKTPMYCAPEVAQECRRGRLADVFSLGCVFLEIVTTLAWFRGVNMAQFSSFRTTDGSKAYHLNVKKNLQWLLSLFGLCGKANSGSIQPGSRVLTKFSSGIYAPLCFPLEWCYAMLQPNPSNRITSSSLATLIESVNHWQDEQRATRYMAHEALNFTKNPSFTGACCRPERLVDKPCSGPTLLQTWPTMLSSVVLDPEFSWGWDYANQELCYNAVPPILRTLGHKPIPYTISLNALQGDTAT